MLTKQKTLVFVGVIALFLSNCTKKSSSTAASYNPYNPFPSSADPNKQATDPNHQVATEQISLVAFSGNNNSSQADIIQRADAENTFGWALYTKLVNANPSQNLAISPVSIESAFSLLYPGAHGPTASEMAQVLGFDANMSVFNPKMGDLLQEIKSAGQTVPTGSSFQISINNNIWTQSGINAQSSYLDTIKTFYNAGILSLDFKANPEFARQSINNQVATDTNNLITNLLPKGSIANSTMMVLTNSLYLLADWQSPFQSDSTQSDTFTKADSTSTQVSMMNQTTSFPYYESATYQALSMPYVGGKLAMLFVLPKTGSTLQTIEAAFSATEIDKILSGQSDQTVSVFLPKFQFQFGTFSLASTLQAMGMVKAFDPKLADFSQILNLASGGSSLFISDVFHETFVKVNEKGTEAAAATAIIMNATMGSPVNQPQPISFRVDHPVLFFLYDVDSHAALFMGRLLTPTTSP